MATQPTLFDDADLPDRFRTAQERYGIWPTTVWPIDHTDQKHRTLRDLVGDEGTVREGCLSDGSAKCGWNRLNSRAGSFTQRSEDLSVYRGKVLASVFSPALCAYILNCYAPSEGLVVDPFAGGGTRAVMAAARGLRYAGTELREEEVAAVRERLERLGYGDTVTIHNGDAREVDRLVGTGVGDFCYTCPPYFDLETYKGGPADLSECRSYAAFCEALADVAAATYRALKPKARSCWVVGLHRDTKGTLLPLHHDTTRAHQQTGFRLLEEVIVNHTGTGSIRRVGQFDKGDRRLVRVHEYMLVFEKEAR